MTSDAVDRIVEQWREQQPDLDVGPMAVVGRISRAARLIERALAEHFAEHGIESWMYDVLATLRRAGEPFELGPTELVAQTMVTTGTMTNRLDRLAERGLIVRQPDQHDRRRLVVRLTPKGRRLVDSVAPGHYGLEADLLASLSRTERATLVKLLRTLLVGLGDTAP